ncbi:hypothetical protein KSP39_PZI018925 [Platanthera zijinensis]|uniref:Uncharacterized protein n=1 Tax=Platanthera zijinensis TaxID=2320716 RepID=A0AAP0B3W9_9ASPA
MFLHLQNFCKNSREPHEAVAPKADIRGASSFCPRATYDGQLHPRARAYSPPPHH